MNARTRTLFHFTKSLDKLTTILKEGLWPQYSLEDITWLDGGVPRLAWPMVSFCDIPILRLRHHSEIYGSYAIGLCREQWSATGLNPVLYISPKSILRDSLREILLAAERNPDPRSQTNAKVLLAHCKPLEGEMMINGERKTNDFYSECEWRFVPWVEGGRCGFFLEEEQFQEQQTLDEANQERRKDLLAVYPSDVRYLLVKTRADVPALMEFIDTTMTCGDSVLRGMLKTRIMVLADVSCDF